MNYKQKSLHSLLRLFLLYIPIYICVGVLHAQSAEDTSVVSADTVVVNDNKIYESVNIPELKTVQLKRTDLVLGYPTLLLSSADKLELSFDDLRGGVHYYTYTFTHCNQNWEPSGLNPFDYLDGFEENPIDDYTFSFGTQKNYTHYAVQFPNDDVGFLVSGNYVVSVWEEEDRTRPVIVKRFFVWEEQAAVSAQVFRPNLIEYRNEFQEINFKVDIRNVDVSNAYDEIRVTVMQNGRFDNAYETLKPSLATNDMLTYDRDDIVFPAGKEFRRFDIKTLLFQSDRIRKIENTNKEYHAWVNVDESRIFGQYYYEKDVNGKYVIDAEHANNPATEGDYALVHFTLQYPYFITSGKFYVFGDYNGYRLTAENEMTYDFDKQQYEAAILMKQGYYNYMYAFRNIDNGKTDLTYGEGNYYETENDYLIFVYQHLYDRDYDKLIGLTVFNSLLK